MRLRINELAVAGLRFVRLLLHVLRGYWIVRTSFPHLNPAEQGRQVQTWAQRTLFILGIELCVQGQVALKRCLPTEQTHGARGPLLLVANHTSWLDVLILLAVEHCRFIAKLEVKQWPVIGALATAANTIYIKRQSRRDALRVVKEMVASLHAGEVISVFPEGTTSAGQTVLPFHANLLQAAIAAQSPVQVVSLSYVDRVTRQFSTAPSYVGDESLLASLWRTLGTPGLQAHVEWGPVLSGAGQKRHVLAAQSRQMILKMRDNKSRSMATQFAELGEPQFFEDERPCQERRLLHLGSKEEFVE